MHTRSCFCRAFALAALALVASGASVRAQVTLDFENLPNPNNANVYNAQGMQVHQNGFTLTANQFSLTSLTSDATASGANYTGSVALYGTDANSGFTTLTQDNGAVFSLLSIDVANFFLNQPGAPITFTGTQQGGATVTQSYTHTNNSNSLETVVFTGDFRNLLSVRFNQDFPSNQVDNIRVVSTAVPEPGSVALFVGIAVTGAGFVRKRRARA